MAMLLYYSAVFVSAFLLFMVQPMLTKTLLPVFGGSYLVWGAAMVFFQSMLLVGYLSSHVLQGRLGVRRYGALHLLLLLVPFWFFPFRFHAAGSDPLGTSLVWGVSRELLLVAGLPFLVLSMTSLVLQRWLMISRLPQRRNPYVLYAASNAGSVVALLAYPVLIEPFSTLEQQALAWWCGYMLLALLHLAVFPWRKVAEHAIAVAGDRGDVTWCDRLRWFLLSLATGTMLLGTTHVITFDIAAIPLLWVLPLALFMLAFVLVFKSRLWFPRWIEGALNWSVLLGCVLALLLRLRIMLPPAVMLLLSLAVLFIVCVNCNACLLRSKPASGQGLTAFYVVLATGGLCGSLLVSWILPRLTHSLLEYPLGLLLVVFSIGWAKSGLGHMKHTFGVWGWIIGFLLVIVFVPRLLPSGYPESLVFALVGLPLALGLRASKQNLFAGTALIAILLLGSGGLDRFASGGQVVARLRNYYGIYHIYDRDGIRYLQHGTTQHGRQYLEAPHRAIPLAYYHPTTPVAQLLELERASISQIGMIGLGTGALAGYVHAGQTLTIFELDPDNLVLAEEHFSYLEQARTQGAELQFVFGDGRVHLASQPAESFDILIMDAFNSGSIPVHLLTVEALETYLQALRPHGIVLLHLSNRVLDLLPVMYANAEAMGLYAVEQSNAGRVHPDAEFTHWMALGRDAARIQHLQTAYGWWNGHRADLPRPWTDRYSNLPGAIRWF